MSPRVLAVLVIAGCLALHAPSLAFELVWDDIDSLVQKSLGCDDAAECFTVATNGTYYRPVFAASMATGYAMADRDPMKAERLMHLQNLVLFALELVCVLFFFTACFGALDARALIATLIFGVHPINASAVDWVTGRAELLPTLFAALGLGLWVRGTKPSLIALGFVAWALAVFSKEQTLPLLVLTPFLFRRQLRALAALLVGGALVAFAWLVITRAVLEGVPPVDPRWSSLEHLSVIVRTLAHSVRLLVLPLPATLHRITAAPWGAFVASELVVMLCGVSLWVWLGFRLRRQPAFVFWLWSSATVLPVLNLIPLNLAFAPYRLVLPLVGVAGLVGGAAKHRLAWVLPVAALGALTILEVPSWRSERTLALAIVDADPENTEWLLVLSRELRENGQLAAALEVASTAVSTVFGDERTVQGLVARASTDAFRKASGEHSSLRRQVLNQFHGAGLLCYRSTVLHALGRFEEEAMNLDACTQIQWEPQWRDKYVEALLRTGRRSEAIAALEALQARAPTPARANRLAELTGAGEP